MATPSWLAASAGSRADAGAITQFLGTHNAQWTYSGQLLESQQATGIAEYVSLASTYYCQTFATGASQTAIGRVALQVSTVGGSPSSAVISPLTVSLYAALSGLPTGAALASATLAEPYLYAQPFWVSVPLTVSGLSPSSLYCLVVSGLSTGSGYYVWQQSSQVTGAATSPDGAAWSLETYGLMYQVYDQTASGQITSIVEDDGARIATFAYTAGLLTGLTEYTAAQDGSTLTSTRTLSYSNGLLTGVA